MSPQVLEKLMLELVGGPAELEPLPAGVIPLYHDPQRESIVASLSSCDEWGIRGRTPPRGRSLATPSAALLPAPSTRAMRRGGEPGAGPSTSSNGAEVGPGSRVGNTRRQGPASLPRGSTPVPRVTRLQSPVIAAAEEEEEEDDDVPLVILRRRRQDRHSPSGSDPHSPPASTPAGTPPARYRGLTSLGAPGSEWGISLHRPRYVLLALTPSLPLHLY